LEGQYGTDAEEIESAIKYSENEIQGYIDTMANIRIAANNQYESDPTDEANNRLSAFINHL
jgi:hypothetical protein